MITNDNAVPNILSCGLKKSDYESYLERRLKRSMEWMDKNFMLPISDDDQSKEVIVCISSDPNFPPEFAVCEYSNGVFYDYDRRGNVTKYVTHWTSLTDPRGKDGQRNQKD